MCCLKIEKPRSVEEDGDEEVECCVAGGHFNIVSSLSEGSENSGKKWENFSKTKKSRI